MCLLMTAAIMPPAAAEQPQVNPSKPELFFGLVGAAGTDLAAVQESLEQVLRGVGYIPEPLKLSELLADANPDFNVSALEDDRIQGLMKLGDDFREKIIKRADAIALLAVAAIRQKRDDKNGSPQHVMNGTAFIFNSLKHPEEVARFRRLYGESFFLIGAYCPADQRVTNLTKRIAKSHTSMEEGRFKAAAKAIIETDQNRSGTNYGQDVRGTFPLSDVFVSDKDGGREQIRRFIELLFGNPFITPSIDEQGMFHARAAALRSSDLSRQVGALISTKKGEFIASGCNEVPAAGGGSVWEGDAIDDRDFQHGRDANAVMKHEIVAEVFDVLKRNNWISELVSDLEPKKFADLALDGDKGKLNLKDTRIASLIEFGRIVHAEMSAITEAARRGVSVKGETLYCTTFPCHMCARHIISSGISRVVYIEPYPKSMTKELYKKAVRVESDKYAASNAVDFEPFLGISPSIYFKIFAMPVRKDKKGYAINWVATSSTPRFVNKSAQYIPVEEGLLEYLDAQMRDRVLTNTGETNGQSDVAQHTVGESEAGIRKETGLAEGGNSGGSEKCAVSRRKRRKI